ncbi:MAG: hypothetical protein EPN48_15305 [Microbacteriaceae bacterium]|nr:MAG: hypothetical protein EPN48_15305 [Microbacteriaceae bacterium]
MAVTESAFKVTAEDTPIDQPRTIRPVRVRRSRPYLAGALALVIAGGLGSAFIYATASHTEQVLVVRHDLQRGELITSADLGSIGVAAGQATQGVPAANAANLLGKVATVDLPKGSLITGRSFAGSLTVPAGQALVGLSLKPSQLPAQPLVAGDRVVIVPVAVNGSSVSASSSAESGTVSEAVRDTASGTTIVDVYVSQTIAADLTSRASAGAVAIFLTASGQ